MTTLQTTPGGIPARPHRGERVADQELIACLLQGDPSAAEEFMARFERFIYLILHKMGVAPQERGDLYQSVIVHLWDQNFRRLRQWEAGKGAFRSFLCVVVTHLVYDWGRGQARRPQLFAGEPLPSLNPPGEDLEALYDRRRRMAAIQAVLRRLPARDRRLIRLKHFQEHSYKEIAAHLGITVSHVGVALARSEQRLRKRLLEAYPELFE